MQSRFIFFWLLGLLIVSRLVLQSRHNNSKWGRLRVTHLDFSCTRLLPIAPLPSRDTLSSFVVLLLMIEIRLVRCLASSGIHPGTLVLIYLFRRTLCQTNT